MLVETLLENAQVAAEADDAWLGSEAHRAQIEEFAASRVRGARVAWLAPGDRSYTQGLVIAMERPVPGGSTRETIKNHVLMVFHEVLHVVHSDNAGAEAFALQLNGLGPFLKRLGNDLFNHLEDARVANREHRAEPGNAAFMGELHRLAMEQEEAEHQHQANESPWTTCPKHKLPQLRMALIERLLVGHRGSDLDPLVVDVLAEAEGALSAGIQSSTTMGARTATLQILEVVIRHWPELTADLG